MLFFKSTYMCELFVFFVFLLSYDGLSNFIILIEEHTLITDH